MMMPLAPLSTAASLRSAGSAAKELPAGVAPASSNHLCNFLAVSEQLVKTAYRYSKGLTEQDHSAALKLRTVASEPYKRLLEKFPKLPPDAGGKASKADLFSAQSTAAEVAACLHPVYTFFQEVAGFQEKTERLLADLHQLLMPVTLSSAPLLVKAYMGLFCNAVRINFLMGDAPRQMVAQLYGAAHQSLHKSPPPHHTQLCHYLEGCNEPVALCQRQFQSITQRVAQVMDLSVVPVLSALGSAASLDGSTIFDVDTLGCSDGSSKLGIAGLSRELTYQRLQEMDLLRTWALFGYLVCPGALLTAASKDAMYKALSDTFHLHIYRDIYVPVHPFYERYVRPTLEARADPPPKSGTGSRRSDQTAATSAATAGGAGRGNNGGGAAVEQAFKDATANAEREHRLRRLLLMAKLERMLVYFQEQPSALPALLAMPTAAVSYAWSELLWYFKHVRDVAPSTAATASGGGKAAAPTPGVAPDVQVLQLLAAVQDVQQLLASYSTAIRQFQALRLLATMRQQLEPQTEAVAKAAELQPELARAVPTLQLVVDIMHRIGEAAAGSSRKDTAAVSDKNVTTAATAAASGEKLLEIADRWVAFCIQLYAARGTLRVAQVELPAKDSRYLDTIQAMLDLCPALLLPPPGPHPSSYSLTGARMPLERGSSGHERPATAAARLAFFAPKLLALMHEALWGSLQHADLAMAHVTAPLRALGAFQSCTEPACGPEDFAGLAVQLAEAALQDICSRLQQLVTALAKAIGARDRPGRPTSEGVPAANPAGSAALVPAAAASSKLLTRLFMPGTTAASPGQDDAPASPTAAPRPAAAAGGAASIQTLLGRAMAVAHALDAAGAVKITDWPFVVVPREHLREALRACLREVLGRAAASAAAAGEKSLVPSPSVFVAEVQDMVQAINLLQPAVSTDLTPTIWEVLLDNCQPPGAAAGGTSLLTATAPDDTLTAAALSRLSRSSIGGLSDGGGGDGGAAAAAAPTAISTYADWYLSTIVRDMRGWGVVFAPQRKAFLSQAKGAADARLYTGIEELTALVQLLGPYAAQALAAKLEAPILECLQQLDQQLWSLQGALSTIMTAYVRTEHCLEEVRQLQPGLATELPATLATVKLLSRALGMRMLIAEATNNAMQSEAPFVSLAIEAVSTLSSSGTLHSPSRHVCDMLQFPRPGYGPHCSPATADPVVTKILVGNKSIDRYQRWHNLPALLAMTFASNSWGAAPFDATARAFTNELHALTFCMKALALAQQEASNQIMPAAASFLHPSTTSVAEDMLRCFSHVASAVIYSRPEAVAVSSCKTLLLDSLACKQFNRNGLAAARVPANRIWSALYQQ